ncbi:MAG: TrkA family potassium uptake protein [Bacillota bacterium]|nr:TrkA family potassium uptake protein [Bacillota bacterium]
MPKSFLVIGAGRFGTSVAKTLYSLGQDVMVVDSDEKLIQQISDEVTGAVQADATSEDVLELLGIKDYEAVILSIGVDIQASIMTAILLVEMGAREIIAKAQTELHGKALSKIGVHRVIYPERDTGYKLARSLVAPTIIDMIELSNDYSVVEVNAPKDMVGKSLQELNLRARYGVSIIALRRDDEKETNISPMAEDIIEENDIIVAIGENKDLQKLEWI